MHLQRETVHTEVCSQRVTLDRRDCDCEHINYTEYSVQHITTTVRLKDEKIQILVEKY